MASPLPLYSFTSLLLYSFTRISAGSLVSLLPSFPFYITWLTCFLRLLCSFSPAGTFVLLILLSLHLSYHLAHLPPPLLLVPLILLFLLRLRLCFHFLLLFLSSLLCNSDLGFILLPSHSFPSCSSSSYSSSFSSFLLVLPFSV